MHILEHWFKSFVITCGQNGKYVAAPLTGRTKKPTNTNFLVGVGVGELQEGIDFLAGD